MYPEKLNEPFVKAATEGSNSWKGLAVTDGKKSRIC